MSMRLSGFRVFFPGVCRVLRSFPSLLFLLVFYLVFFLIHYITTVLSSAQKIGEIRLLFSHSCLQGRFTWIATSLASLRTIVPFFTLVAICQVLDLQHAYLNLCTALNGYKTIENDSHAQATTDLKLVVVYLEYCVHLLLVINI